MPLLILQDKPAFKHRGVMIDTSRHFIPVEILLKNLDAMMYNKMNVFHWHITDDDSFPLEVSAYPDLANNSKFGLGMTYSPQ
jgi:hexosaminidase